MTKVSKPALSAAELTPIISSRFSPRIYDSKHQISESELLALGEAFRWAPSSMNDQPWHVIFLTRGSQLHQQLSESGLTGFNQSWAPTASAYAVVLAAKQTNGKERNQASTFFDVGLAAQQMALQAQSMGLSSHYMGGIVREQIEQVLGITDHWVVCVMTFGVQGDLEGHSPEIVEREQAPRVRKDPQHVYRINSQLG